MKTELGDFIEQGTYAKIYKSKKDSRKVLRIIQKDGLKEMDPYREIRIMQKINCDFVIKFYDWIENSKNIIQELEYMPGNDLFQKIANRVTVTEALDYIKQTLLAVKWIHDKKILHRDIKPENILFDLNGKLKLCDFGFAKFFKPGKKYYKAIGTPYYMAPEMIDNIGYDHRIDIWAIGVIFYEMLYGHLPYDASNRNDLLEKISFEPVFYPVISKQLTKYSKIVKSILQKDYSERATILEILSSL